MPVPPPASRIIPRAIHLCPNHSISASPSNTPTTSAKPVIQYGCQVTNCIGASVLGTDPMASVHGTYNMAIEMFNNLPLQIKEIARDIEHFEEELESFL